MVNTASMVYRFGRLDLDDLDGARRRYRSQRAYAAAKLATVVFTPGNSPGACRAPA